MKKDGTAGKGRALLRHLAVVLVFVLAALMLVISAVKFSKKYKNRG